MPISDTKKILTAIEKLYTEMYHVSDKVAELEYAIKDLQKVQVDMLKYYQEIINWEKKILSKK